MLCPYQDICATTRYWSKEKKDFIQNVCNTEEHKKCVHFAGLVRNPLWVKDARELIKCLP